MILGWFVSGTRRGRVDFNRATRTLSVGERLLARK